MNKRKLDSLKTKKSLSRNELKNLTGGNDREMRPPNDLHGGCDYTVFYCRWAHGGDGSSNEIGQCCV